MNEFQLKYGTNPNQKPARIYMADGSDLPVQILNGRPGYINFLDAFNAWQLVRELNELQVKRFVVKPKKRRPDREKLRAARKRCGFDQRTVARVLHVGQPMVSGWENGEGISRKNLQKLARLYLVEVSELLED